jgi:hypothetical protein
VDEHNELLSSIDSALESIDTREDLVAFVDLLAEGIEKDAFDKQSMINYIEAIALVLEGLENLYRNTGMSYPESPDWKLFGRVLLSAFYR